MTSPHRINAGSGPEIVPTTREFPLWLRDLALALSFFAGLFSLSYLLDRWEETYALQAQVEQLKTKASTCARTK